jgi:hypothetical protein
MEPRKINALLVISDSSLEEIAAEAQAKVATVKAVVYGLRRTGPLARRVMEAIEHKTGKSPDELWAA